ncbi:MAG: alpha/beta hydrolase family protein [Woeseiaceae bacterium]
MAKLLLKKDLLQVFIAMTRFLSGLVAALISLSAVAEQNRIDTIRHDAPELAYFGEHTVGVRTLRLSNPGQVDVLNSTAAAGAVLSTRRLTVEVWYPAVLGSDQQSGGQYETTTRNLAVTATLHGRAVRNAEADNTLKRMPLVIISHGYPGNRYLMSHLAENLASKGYVVAAIDHADSTYEDQATIWSTLYHRPQDQLFVVNEISLLSKSKDSFLMQIVDTDRVGIVGYSMGGYGLLVNMGAGYTDMTADFAEDLPATVAKRNAASNLGSESTADTRIKAGIAIAPCCMNRGMWNQEALGRITTPVMFMAGSIDETAGYANGVRAVFDATVNSDRYLLTFQNAGHNAIAPIPLPVEIHESEDQAGAFHYTDAVWDSTRSSNIMFHFTTAFLDYHLKGDASRLSYLELVENSQEGIWSVEDGAPTDEHSYWQGFPQFSARGLVLEHQPPAGQ